MLATLPIELQEQIVDECLRLYLRTLLSTRPSASSYFSNSCLPLLLTSRILHDFALSNPLHQIIYVTHHLLRICKPSPPPSIPCVSNSVRKSTTFHLQEGDYSITVIYRTKSPFFPAPILSCRIWEVRLVPWERYRSPRANVIDVTIPLTRSRRSSPNVLPESRESSSHTSLKVLIRALQIYARHNTPFDLSIENHVRPPVRDLLVKVFGFIERSDAFWEPKSPFIERMRGLGQGKSRSINEDENQ